MAVVIDEPRPQVFEVVMLHDRARYSPSVRSKGSNISHLPNHQTTISLLSHQINPLKRALKNRLTFYFSPAAFPTCPGLNVGPPPRPVSASLS